MSSAYEDLLQITDPAATEQARLFAMRGFADKLRWRPSYELNVPVEDASAFDHLVVEHGLSNSAVITFLRGDARASSLTMSQLRHLLAISYNNLVDWHIFVSRDDMRKLNNLRDWAYDPRSESLARIFCRQRF